MEQEGVGWQDCGRVGFLKWTENASHTVDRGEHSHFRSHERRALKTLTGMQASVGKEKSSLRKWRTAGHRLTLRVLFGF